jgi:protocatechuate 3,4-dioxygenase beta subunit
MNRPKRSHAYLIAFLGTVPLRAAVIRGVVVEALTNRALARAAVTVQPLSGTPGDTRWSRTDRRGSFAFRSLAPGLYLVSASRTAFMPAQYGQKRWNSAGMPMMLDEVPALFLRIQLHRFSAINGTVVDENDEGLPAHEVLAYRDSKPPELIARATSDERGVFRLQGLPPGTYVVRTAGGQSEGASYLPTYAGETAKFDEARTVEVLPDQEANDIEVRPLVGRLYALSVDVNSVLDASITLVSETGRRTVKAVSHRFTRLPPGEYEVFAQSPSDPTPGDKIMGACQHISLGSDSSVSLLLRNPSAVVVTGVPANAAAEILLRPADVAGGGATSVLPVHNGAALIPIGHWEVMLQPPPGFYVSGVSDLRSSSNGWRPDGWQELTSPGKYELRISVSAGPSSIHGTVKNSDDPVPYAPVYLEAYSLAEGKRVAELRTAASDVRGQYRFDDLAPGNYRILATFEYLAPDANMMSAAGAQIVTLDAHAELALDLDLYIVP